jgi:hypothetical protein
VLIVSIRLRRGCLQSGLQIFVLDLNSKTSALTTDHFHNPPIILQISQMATTQSIHMGPEWMRAQPASQTTINSPGKNPSSQPPPLGIASNALRYVEGLKTPATAATGATAERGALGSTPTAQAAPANGTPAPGEWDKLLWYPRSCSCHSRVYRAGSFFGDGPSGLPHTPSLIITKEYLRFWYF